MSDYKPLPDGHPLQKTHVRSLSLGRLVRKPGTHAPNATQKPLVLAVPASPHLTNAAPIPLANWPAWAKAVRDERELPTDKGVGDTVHRRLGDGGIIARAWAAMLGIPCRCAARRAEWNVLYPYSEPSSRM